MSLLAVSIIAIVAFILSILCLVVICTISIRHKAKITMLTSQYQAQEIVSNNSQRVNEKLQLEIDKLHKEDKKLLAENTQVSKQLEHRIKTLQTQINTQVDIISQLQTDQGDDKFYTRAIKLAKKGANIDEIVTECELPYAEVEMLISIYQKQISS